MKKIFPSLLLLIYLDSANATGIQKLQAYFGPSFFQYTLSSDQFAADQPNSTGQAYLLNYSYQNEDSLLEHRFSLLNSSHNLSVPSSLSPSSIRTTQTKLNYKMVSSRENFNLGAGYSFYKNKTDETTPNILISSSESQAIDLFLERYVWHKSNLAVQIFADFELPFIKKELGTNTGFNPRSYTVHLGYTAKYLFNDVWSVVQRSEYTFDSTRFDGSGNRGTLNAKEKSQRFQFLLGAGYDF